MRVKKYPRLQNIWRSPFGEKLFGLLNMAGWLIPILLDTEIGNIQSSYRKVFFGKSLVSINNLEVPFNLQFKPVHYLVDITLVFWEYYKEDVGGTLKRIEQKIDSLNEFEIT